MAKLITMRFLWSIKGKKEVPQVLGTFYRCEWITYKVQYVT